MFVCCVIVRFVSLLLAPPPNHPSYTQHTKKQTQKTHKKACDRALTHWVTDNASDQAYLAQLFKAEGVNVNVLLVTPQALANAQAGHLPQGAPEQYAR